MGNFPQSLHKKLSFLLKQKKIAKHKRHVSELEYIEKLEGEYEFLICNQNLAVRVGFKRPQPFSEFFSDVFIFFFFQGPKQEFSGNFQAACTKNPAENVWGLSQRRCCLRKNTDKV